jgi:nucleoside-diphosphate-sugar epimerase
MKILVTGGAGFIGSHLAEALLEQGDEVFIIDDLSTGSVENIEHLQAHPRFHYFFETMMNRHVMAELIDRTEMVFHFAAAVGVKLIVESPVRTIETNLKGTEIVLELASKKGKKVVLASTTWGPRLKGGGVMPAQRPLMSFLPFRIGKNGNAQRSLRVYLIPWDLDRRVNMEWSFRDLCPER